MARIGNGYEAEFENTEKQGGGGGLLPHMYAKLQAESINLVPTKDSKGYQAEITFEVLEPEEFAKRKVWAYWTIVHSDGYEFGQYRYGKPMFDRFGRSVGVQINADTDTDELLFREFVAEVGIQIGNKKPDGTFYKDKNQIDRFYYNDDEAKEPIPELGVIGDGTQGKKRNEPQVAPANDNRPAQAAAGGATGAAAAGGATGRKPWGAK